MRILFVTNNFPNPLEPTRGMFNYYTARALARTNDVVVIAQVSWRDEWGLRGQGPALPRMRMLDGLEVHHPRHWYPPGILRQTYGWFLWQSVRATVRAVRSRFHPDVVLGSWVHPDGDTALRIAGECGVPGVVMAGGSDVLALGRDPARRRCIVDVLQRADAVVCVSRHLKNAVEEIGIPSERIHVVRRGVDATHFSPGDRQAARRQVGLDPTASVLLWVGRMVPVKGLDVLLDAYAASQPAHTGSTLCLVGDGSLRQALADRAAQLGIAGRVRFVGNVTHDELAVWYRAADVTVLPSHSEGLPNVLIESMACGTPFIASNVGGVSEIADRRLDRLVPPGDVAALARAIRERVLLKDTPGRALLPPTWDDHASSMEAVFREAIAAKGTRPTVGVHGYRVFGALPS